MEEALQEIAYQINREEQYQIGWGLRAKTPCFYDTKPN